MSIPVALAKQTKHDQKIDERYLFENKIDLVTTSDISLFSLLSARLFLSLSLSFHCLGMWQLQRFSSCFFLLAIVRLSMSFSANNLDDDDDEDDKRNGDLFQLMDVPSVDRGKISSQLRIEYTRLSS